MNYSKERAEADFWPTLDLYLSSNIRRDTNGERGETKEFGAALQLNYELYDGGARYGEIDKNHRYLMREYQKSYDERRNVNEMVRLAWNILAAEKYKKEFLVDHVRLSKQTLDEFTQEFHAGKRDLLEILDMEIEFYNARSAQVESRYSYLVAYFRTIQAMGGLLALFDTQLVETLGLEQDREMEAFTYARLREILGEDTVLPDRDHDATDDCADQCDNTEDGATLEEFGCNKINSSEAGYLFPLELTPYIIE